MAETLDVARLAEEALDAWERDRPGLIAVDTETEGFEFFDPPFCVTAAWDSPAGIRSAFLDLAHPTGFEVAGAMLEGPNRWVFHNAKFDLQKLALVGLVNQDLLDPGQFEDTQILSYLSDEHRRHGLKVLTHDLLGETTDEEEVLRAVRRKLKLKKDDGYHLLPREVLVPYAVKDAEFTLRLYPLLLAKLRAVGDPQLLELYDMEKELVLVLLSMESRGLGVDLNYVDATTKEYGHKAVVLELGIRDLTGDEDFNPQSNPQIRAAFERRGITAEKFDKYVLKDLDDPLADSILELRSTKKLHGTYLLPIQHEQRDGILHPNFRNTNTRTGRLASGGAEAE